MASTTRTHRFWCGDFCSAMKSPTGRVWFLQVLAALLLIWSSGHHDGVRPARAQLFPNYYGASCPNLESIVQSQLQSAFASDSRIAASLLRLHFHDCFVDGCDGSIFLVDTPTFQGEQSAIPNRNSARGFNVIDDIKAAVEAACPNTVSCADILALAARDSVVLTGGPNWPVLLGRYDSSTASQANANALIPAPFDNYGTLTSLFANNGLSQIDLVALSGAHTIGFGHCNVVNVIGNSRLYNWSPNSDTVSGTGQPDPNIDPSFLASLQSTCNPQNSPNTLLNMDPASTTTFDNSYFQLLLARQGLFSSDQTLQYSSFFSSGLVTAYANSQALFFNDFVNAIIKMGNISPKNAFNGEIRRQCGFAN